LRSGTKSTTCSSRAARRRERVLLACGADVSSAASCARAQVHACAAE
jgi:hypothetical protein